MPDGTQNSPMPGECVAVGCGDSKGRRKAVVGTQRRRILQGPARREPPLYPADERYENEVFPVRGVRRSTTRSLPRRKRILAAAVSALTAARLPAPVTRNPATGWFSTRRERSGLALGGCSLTQNYCSDGRVRCRSTTAPLGDILTNLERWYAVEIDALTSGCSTYACRSNWTARKISRRYL